MPDETAIDLDKDVNEMSAETSSDETGDEVEETPNRTGDDLSDNVTEFVQEEGSKSKSSDTDEDLNQKVKNTNLEDRVNEGASTSLSCDASTGKKAGGCKLLNGDELIAYFQSLHTGPCVTDGVTTIGLVRCVHKPAESFMLEIISKRLSLRSAVKQFPR